MAVYETNGASFEQDVLKNEKTVLVDFYATWCGPCKMLSPIVEEASEQATDVAFYKLDVDQATELAFQYQISSIPALIVFKNGQAVKRSVGFCMKEDILAMLK